MEILFKRKRVFFKNFTKRDKKVIQYPQSSKSAVKVTLAESVWANSILGSYITYCRSVYPRNLFAIVYSLTLLLC